MDSMPIGDLAPEISVLITAVATLLLAMVLPRGRLGLCLWPALAGLVVAMVFASAELNAAHLTFSGSFALDGATGWARLLILGSGAACLLLCPRWFESDARHGELYAMVLFSVLGAMSMAGASDLMQLVIGMLLSSITGYVLAAYHRDWAASLEAGMKYFLLGALANALAVMGAVFMMGAWGTTDYAAIRSAAPELATQPLALVGVMLVMAGLLFKLGAVPGHAWVPDVAEGAPAPMAAFLTSVPKIAAAIALYRFVPVPQMEGLALLVALAAALTMSLGNLVALRQDDLRRLLGWSSVGQAGYALMGVAVAGQAPQALPALLVFMGAYAIGTIAAFAMIVHLRGRTAIDDYSGLGRRRPMLLVGLGLAFASFVGLPPLLGFFGKLGLFLAAFEANLGWLVLIGALNSVLSLAVYLRVLGRMAFSAPGPAPAATLGRSGLWVMVLLSAGLLLGAAFIGPLWALLPIAALP